MASEKKTEASKRTQILRGGLQKGNFETLILMATLQRVRSGPLDFPATLLASLVTGGILCY